MAQVAALAWRPSAGQALAVGCAGGVCLWSLRRCPAGGAPSCRASVAGSHTAAWLTFLHTHGRGDCPRSCLDSISLCPHPVCSP